jgi:hypothetical protein
MAAELPPIRRVVAGDDRTGKSVFIEDGPSAFESSPTRPGFRDHKIWATRGPSFSVDDLDRSGEVTGIMPPLGGSLLRILDFPSEPLDAAECERVRAERREQARPRERGVRRFDDFRHAGMHATDTVDYAIVMSGEIYAIMDSEERLLKAGDVLIQRGNSHGWSNRSGSPCRIAFVLIEGLPAKK